MAVPQQGGAPDIPPANGPFELASGVSVTWDGSGFRLTEYEHTVMLTARELVDIVRYAVRCNPVLAERLACATRTAP